MTNPIEPRGIEGSESPLISVIIPSYNSARFVTDAVYSALGQTYRPIEVIVIDDGSTDDTATVLRPLLDQIRYVRQENRGLSGARNRGIQEAKGSLLALLDADDKWLPEKLTRQWQYLKDHPDAGLVHTDVNFWRPDRSEIFHEARPRGQFAGNCYARLFFESRVLPSSVLLRREAVERAGLFDEQFRRVEDLDLWLRIARYFTFAYIDEPLVLYRLHDSSLTRNDLKMREGELAALQKALRADPDLERMIGRNSVRRRLHELCFGIGYHYYEQSDLRKAREYFARAWRLQPSNAYSGALWLATLLPARIRNGIRRWKQSRQGAGANRPSMPDTRFATGRSKRNSGTMKPPLPILYAHASSLVGGANKVLLRIFAELDRRRFAPRSVIPGPGPMEAELTQLDVPYFRLDLRASSQSQFAQAASVLRLALLNTRFRPALLHANEMAYRTAALGALGSKRLCHLHHPGSTVEGLAWLFRRIPDLIVTPSLFVKREVSDRLNGCGLSVPIEAVWNPIDLERFVPDQEVATTRARLGMPPDQQHISILGALAPHKGHECFLRMAREVISRLPATNFHIIGGDMGRHAEHACRLQRLAGELGVTERVKFWGFVDDDTARDLLAASDLFVLPSSEEGFGLVLAEAQACGVPVLATAIEPLTEVVDHGQTGYLLQLGDARSFAEHAVALLQAPQRRHAMGEAGRRWVQQRFGMRQYVERMTELYERVLAPVGA